MIKLLKKYMKRYRALIAGNLFIVLFQVIIQTVFLMSEMKKIIELGVGLKDMDMIIQCGVRMIIYTIIVGVCTVVASMLSAKITASITCDVRRDCYKKVSSLSPQDYSYFGESTLLIRTLTDGTQIQLFMINIMRSALTVPFVIILMLILVFRMNKVLFGILFAAFSLTVCLLAYVGSKSKPLFAKQQEKLDNINLLMKEKITGVRAIRAFNNEAFEEDKMRKANDEAYEAAILSNKKINFLSPTACIIMNWTIVLIYLAGSVQLQMGMASISDLLLVFQYLTYFISCIAIVPVLVNLLPKMVVSCGRINEVLDYEPIVSNNEGMKQIDMSAGEVVFENVIFGYSKANEVIANVSFTVAPGKTTAFIGTTGSGKTTIMNLVMGLYTPVFGRIIVDGQSLKEVDLKDYRKHLSYATQNAYVFQDTARNNITMYDESITQERIQEACKAACFNEVVELMPDGLDTVMAQNGRNISGGQRQRMSLARTIAKNADIYIFDDSFSALDAKTEKTALSEIKKMLKDKTIIMVAQKISTIREADNIIVLDKGRIVGQGKHEDLLATCCEYQEIYKTQCYLNKDET